MFFSIFIFFSESLLYGFGPLIWGSLTWDQVRLYPSSLSLTVQLCIISCLYSLFVISYSLVRRGTQDVIKSLFSYSDIIRDPRYLFLAAANFLKIWFSLRLVKTCDGPGSFFFLSYADTFVVQILDKAMA